MQLQGELQANAIRDQHYRGPFHGVSVILRHEGVRGLYRGLGCAYIYQILLNGCRLGFYEPMRASLGNLLYNDEKVQSLPINILCGATSGVLGAAAASPFSLIKTRLQSCSTSFPVGTQHLYRNAADGMVKIYRTEGIPGLYRGVSAAMVRTGFGSSVQLPVYFFTKRKLQETAGLEEGLLFHLGSSAISGFAVCCFMHPPGEFILILPYCRTRTKTEHFRHHHVSPLQSERQSIHKHVRLFLKDDTNGKPFRYL